MFSVCIFSLRVIFPSTPTALLLIFCLWWSWKSHDMQHRGCVPTLLIYCQKAPRREILRLLFKNGVRLHLWSVHCRGSTSDQTLTHQIGEYLQKSAGSYSNCWPQSSLLYEAGKPHTHARGRVCPVFTSSRQRFFFALLTHHHYIWVEMLPDEAFSGQVLTLPAL